MRVIWWICTLAIALIGALGLIEKLVTLAWRRRVWGILLAIFAATTIVQTCFSLLQERKAKADIAAVREYSWIARLDALGNPPGTGFGSALEYKDELTGLLKDMYTIIGNQLIMKKGPEPELRYRKVIERFPKFPFGHYFLALSLRDRGVDEWQTHAIEAIRILRITTQFDGHNANHDEILQKLSLWIEEK